MILRHATTDDVAVLEQFDLGSAVSPWLDEVREIVGGLVAWRDDIDHVQLDRRVLVGIDNDEIVAVTADECLETELGSVLADHRYLMVVAVRADRHRTGTARLATESLFAAMKRDNVHTVRWLVHPGNVVSVAFSRAVFPDAEETHPPEDKPYLAYTLTL